MTRYELGLKRDLLWEERFDELLKYRDLYGTIIVPNRSRDLSYPYWERRLGIWVDNQRQRYKRGKLVDWRYDKLISVDFDFDPNVTIFEQHFADFLKFKEKYGHTLIPRDCTEFPGLSSWVHHIREKSCREDWKRRLDKEGFVWKAIDEFWQNKFRELVEYKRSYGNFKIYYKNEKSQKLLIWANRIRVAKRRNTPSLSEEQIQLLDSIGFDWEPAEVTWNQNISKLKEFIAKHNHTYVPIKLCEIEGLGTWVAWARNNKNRLTCAQIEELDALGFEWDSEFAYRKRNNILNINGLGPEEYTSKITPARQIQIDTDWELKFNELLKYKDAHGNTNVPDRIKIPGTNQYNLKLGSWVMAQRMLYRKGTIQKWRYDKLVSVGFDFDPKGINGEKKNKSNL
jgi:hypothetical protein